MSISDGLYAVWEMEQLVGFDLQGYWEMGREIWLGGGIYPVSLVLILFVS